MLRGRLGMGKKDRTGKPEEMPIKATDSAFPLLGVNTHRSAYDETSAGIWHSIYLNDYPPRN